MTISEHADGKIILAVLQKLTTYYSKDVEIKAIQNAVRILLLEGIINNNEMITFLRWFIQFKPADKIYEEHWFNSMKDRLIFIDIKIKELS